MISLDSSHIRFAPADEAASEQTAKIFSGYVRNVEYLSKAQTHVDDAFGQMVGGNRGYAGVLTERKPGSFKQQLVIRGFPDANAVYLGEFKRPDQMDLDHGFVRDSCTEAEFKRDYPHAEQTDFADWGADFIDWYNKDSHVVKAEYWKLRFRRRFLVQLNQPVPVQRGRQQIQSDAVYDDELKVLFPGGLPEGLVHAAPRRRIDESVVPTSYSDLRYYLKCPKDLLRKFHQTLLLEHLYNLPCFYYKKLYFLSSLL